ncbi:MAG: sulfite oxidase-like oxidoreductase [Chloroflexi bacterium]|nr:sulfite oxidase-like oxidoreductase [Chloroflexota bacterium]
MDGIFRRKEEEKRMGAEGRLPPGQALTTKFPVLHYGTIPTVDLTTWTLRIWGAVEQPFELSWEEFNRLPRTTLHMDIHCVTQWSKFDTTWEGVALRTLVDEGLLRLKPEAKHVLQHADHGYTTNLPLDVMLQDNFLLATHFNGEPITPEHGYPLRGVVGAIPNRADLKTPYFWKGAKWLRGLEFLTQDQLGFWEKAGYHNDADIWKEQRYASQG